MKVKEESEKIGLKQHSDKEDHGIWSHHFMGNRWGNSGNSVRLYFFWGGAPKSLQMAIAAMKLKDAYSLEQSYDQRNFGCFLLFLIFLKWMLISLIFINYPRRHHIKK